MTETKAVDAFICYRRGDREDVADWLYANLHQRRITGPSGTVYRVQVYQDQRVAGVTDWQRAHREALLTSEIFLVVCSRMLVADFSKQDGQDWVQGELDLWAERTDVAPLLIETQRHERDRIVPRRFAATWSNVQGIVLDDVVALDADPDEKRRKLEQLDQTIVERFEAVHKQDLAEKEARIRALSRSRRWLVGSLAAAVVLAGASAWFGAGQARALEDLDGASRIARAQLDMAEGLRMEEQDPLVALGLAAESLVAIEGLTAEDLAVLEDAELRERLEASYDDLAATGRMARLASFGDLVVGEHAHLGGYGDGDARVRRAVFLRPQGGTATILDLVNERELEGLGAFDSIEPVENHPGSGLVWAIRVGQVVGLIDLAEPEVLAWIEREPDSRHEEARSLSADRRFLAVGWEEPSGVADDPRPLKGYFRLASGEAVGVDDYFGLRGLQLDPTSQYGRSIIVPAPIRDALVADLGLDPELEPNIVLDVESNQWDDRFAQAKGWLSIFDFLEAGTPMLLPRDGALEGWSPGLLGDGRRLRFGAGTSTALLESAADEPVAQLDLDDPKLALFAGDGALLIAPARARGAEPVDDGQPRPWAVFDPRDGGLLSRQSFIEPVIHELEGATMIVEGDPDWAFGGSELVWRHDELARLTFEDRGWAEGGSRYGRAVVAYGGRVVVHTAEDLGDPGHGAYYLARELEVVAGDPTGAAVLVERPGQSPAILSTADASVLAELAEFDFGILMGIDNVGGVDREFVIDRSNGVEEIWSLATGTMVQRIEREPPYDAPLAILVDGADAWIERESAHDSLEVRPLPGGAPIAAIPSTPTRARLFQDRGRSVSQPAFGSVFFADLDGQVLAKLVCYVDDVLVLPSGGALVYSGSAPFSPETFDRERRLLSPEGDELLTIAGERLLRFPHRSDGSGGAVSSGDVAGFVQRESSPPRVVWVDVGTGDQLAVDPTEDRYVTLAESVDGSCFQLHLDSVLDGLAEWDLPPIRRAADAAPLTGPGTDRADRAWLLVDGGGHSYMVGFAEDRALRIERVGGAGVLHEGEAPHGPLVAATLDPDLGVALTFADRTLHLLELKSGALQTWPIQPGCRELELLAEHRLIAVHYPEHVEVLHLDGRPYAEVLGDWVGMTSDADGIDVSAWIGEVGSNERWLIEPEGPVVASHFIDDWPLAVVEARSGDVLLDLWGSPDELFVTADRSLVAARYGPSTWEFRSTATGARVGGGDHIVDCFPSESGHRLFIERNDGTSELWSWDPASEAQLTRLGSFRWEARDVVLSPDLSLAVVHGASGWVDLVDLDRACDVAATPTSERDRIGLADWERARRLRDRLAPPAR